MSASADAGTSCDSARSLAVLGQRRLSALCIRDSMRGQHLDEPLDQRRVERRSAVLAQRRDGFGVGARRPVGPVGQHRREAVDDGDDPGAERDVLSPLRPAG